MSKYYQASLQLLSVLAQLENEMKRNYQGEDISERALATIGGLQCDLFSSYTLLLTEHDDGPIVGRAIILRSILENQGTLLHIKGNKSRSDKYLGHVLEIEKQFKISVSIANSLNQSVFWSASKITQRVSLIDDKAIALYDMLSNFVHGNNILYFFDTKEIVESFVEAIDAYYIGVFISFLSELGIGLTMNDDKRKLIFDSIEKIAQFR